MSKNFKEPVIKPVTEDQKYWLELMINNPDAFAYKTRGMDSHEIKELLR